MEGSQAEPKDLYTQCIAEHFPELRYEEARLITTGWDNDVVILDEAYVFRFPKGSGYGERFRAEVRFLKGFSPQSPIALPDYTFLPADIAFGGYSILPGTELRPEIYRSFSADQQKNMAKQVGEFLSVLHATPIENARTAGFDYEPGDYWWNQKHTAEILVGLRDQVFGKLKPKEVDWVEQQFERYLALDIDLELTVIHSDFIEDHIFVDPSSGEICGVIDFADLEIADPALDFTGLWNFGEDFLYNTLKHYTGMVDRDFVDRCKFPRLIYMVGNMLEIMEGKKIPKTLDKCHAELQQVMDSGFTL